MKKSVSELISLSGSMFEKQYPMLQLYQTLADHYYPERADFTITRNIGSEFADQILDSYPILVRRDLANSFHAMLRDGKWFEMYVEDADHMGNMWTEWASQRLKRMFDTRASNFVRATKEGDHDYATFGQTVISTELNKHRNGLLFRSWHLRDCAWFDDETGQVGGVARKWSPEIHQLIATFGEEKVHKNITKENEKTPFKTADCRHLVLPSEMYGDDELTEKAPYVSLYIDVANEDLIEEVGINHQYYTIPRFQTVAGSPYAYSPAAIVGLPNARCLQAMTHTLLEAGERYARPPIIATQKAVRSDVDFSPDGVTWVDNEYDERLGAALRPMTQDRGGFPIGLEMRNGIVDILASAFYINKLGLPEIGTDMTAYEVSERMKQYRRENLPLFAPLESEYNGQLCENAFNIALNAGLMGSPQDIPQSLQGRKIEFKFQSPLTESESEKKAQQFSHVSQMLREAAEIDPGVRHNVNVDEAFRDAVDGTGAPAKWLQDMETVMQGRQGDQMQQMAQMAADSGIDVPQ